MDVKVKCLSETARLPVYATPGAAAADLCADLAQPLTLEAGQRALVPTGLALELPGPEYVALVFARSGLAVRQGIALSNGVGVIDSDYRGEVKVALQNHGDQPYTVHCGDRIAQMAVMPVFQPELEWTDELPDTQRGAGGFGSTGM